MKNAITLSIFLVLIFQMAFSQTPPFSNYINQSTPADEIINGNYVKKVLNQQHLATKSPTTHFQRPGGNPSDSTWIIYFNVAAFNDFSLNAGDEIAIVDVDQDSLIIDAKTLTALPNPAFFQQFVIAYIQSEDSSKGNISGNKFALICGESENDVEIQAFDV
jgi:ABC-type transport system involved in multi-copper enzyme maturation permease subunit